MENQSYHYDLIARAIQFLQEHQKQQPSLEAIAQHVHLSKFHLQRLFRRWVGISPKEFLQFLTIEEAKLALKSGQSTLESAFDVGLSGNGRLHDLFVKIEACTPGEFKNRGKGMQIQWETIETLFGPAIVAETSKGLFQLSFDLNAEQAQEEWSKEYPEAQLQKILGPNAQLAQTYLQNWKLPPTPIELFLKGTPFQIQVWKALLQIPSAQLLAYGDIAHGIKRPKAVRAIGTAIGKNPIAYLIPCHRVIRSGGQLGGYRWGTERKANIIAYERTKMQIS